MMWEATRDTVIENFPKAPGLPKDSGAYLRNVDEIYQSDAYHSLSIEGYSVTPELIDRVRQGDWNPDNDEADRKKPRRAGGARLLAGVPGRERVGEQSYRRRKSRRARARGTQGLVPRIVPALRDGGPASRRAIWRGYRNNAVYLRTSRYVPPRWEAVRDAMPAFFDLLEKETEPSVRAVLGHWLFGYIHPYPDGNGRMARFLMNVMLASGGYPWTVIRVEGSQGLSRGAGRASIDVDLGPVHDAHRTARALGPGETRSENFPIRAEKFDFDREVVLSSGRTERTACGAPSAEKPWTMTFRADNRDKVEVFRENRTVIEEAARQKYLTGDTETDGSILVHTGELARRKG